MNFINPIDAMMALMVKWVVKATKPNDSNLHYMLEFRLANFQPYSQRRWASSLEFFTLPKFQATSKSKVYNQVGTVWWELVKEISKVRPFSFEEVMNGPFW